MASRIRELEKRGWESQAGRPGNHPAAVGFVVANAPMLNLKKIKIFLSHVRLLKTALCSTWRQLDRGVKTSGRGTPVISFWPADLKKGWKGCPWIWQSSHPDGDVEMVNGQLKEPPLLTLVYVRIPRRAVVVQFAWESREFEKWGRI